MLDIFSETQIRWISYFATGTLMFFFVVAFVGLFRALLYIVETF